MANYPTIDNPSTLPTLGLTALLRTAWRKKIEYMKVKQDPLVGSLDSSLYGTLLVGKYDVQKKMYAIPNKVIQDLTPEFGDEARYAREFVLTLSIPLSAEGHLGETDALGTEEEPTWKYAKVYSNDIGHASALQEYGITAREKIPLNIQSQIQAMLATWRGERQGYDMRYAVINRRSPNLEITPFSLTAAFNPHAYIIGEAAAGQPVYDSTDATYNADVVTKLNAATLANNKFTLSNLIALSSYLQDNYICPIQYENMYVWILYISREQMDRLKDPVITNSWGAYIKDVACVAKYDVRQIIPGASFIIGDNLVVCEDERTARAGITTTTLTQYYLKMGRNDERAGALGQNRAFDINLLLGKNALAKVTAQQWQFKFELQNYDKYKGVDYNGAESWQLPLYDVDTPTDTSIISEGSAIVFTSVDE